MSREESFPFEVNVVDRALLKRDPATAGALDATGTLRVLPHEFWRQFTQLEIAAFCVTHGIYCVPTQELVDWLRSEIGTRKAIEVGSGNGVLARALGIMATDNRQQEWPEIAAYYAAIKQPTIKYGENVKPIPADRAISAFKPRVVISTWVTHKYVEAEHYRGGNVSGIREEQIIARARYISVCNRHVHRYKPALELPHTEHEFPWLVSRATNGTPDFVAVWG